MIRIYSDSDPIMREKSEPVSDFSTLSMFLLPRMKQAMEQEDNAIGISAVQIGVLKQVFIMRRHGELIIVCNPEIVSYSKKTDKKIEGCLSVDNMVIEIERSTNITVKYFDETGQMIIDSFSDMDARVFQHEYDHLHGVLILDHAVMSYDDVSALRALDNNDSVNVKYTLGKDDFSNRFFKNQMKDFKNEDDTYTMSIMKMKLSCSHSVVKRLEYELRISDN